MADLLLNQIWSRLSRLSIKYAKHVQGTGGYYEAILQIRTKQKSVLDAAVEKVFKDIDSSPAEFFSTENGPVRWF